MLISDHLSKLLIPLCPKTFIPLSCCASLCTREWLVLYINDADREPSRQCQCCLLSGYNVYTCTHVHPTDLHRHTVWRAMHTFDPDKGKSMRFLSRVHSRRASPTVLNLMELEYAKMREDDIGARGNLPEFSPILPIYPKLALILTWCRITEKRRESIKLRILLKSRRRKTWSKLYSDFTRGFIKVLRFKVLKIIENLKKDLQTFYDLLHKINGVTKISLKNTTNSQFFYANIDKNWYKKNKCRRMQYKKKCNWKERNRKELSIKYFMLKEFRKCSFE